VAIHTVLSARRTWRFSLIQRSIFAHDVRNRLLAGILPWKDSVCTQNITVVKPAAKNFSMETAMNITANCIARRITISFKCPTVLVVVNLSLGVLSRPWVEYGILSTSVAPSAIPPLQEVSFMRRMGCHIVLCTMNSSLVALVASAVSQ